MEITLVGTCFWWIVLYPFILQRLGINFKMVTRYGGNHHRHRKLVHITICIYITMCGDHSQRKTRYGYTYHRYSSSIYSTIICTLIVYGYHSQSATWYADKYCTHRYFVLITIFRNIIEQHSTDITRIDIEPWCIVLYYCISQRMGINLKMVT